MLLAALLLLAQLGGGGAVEVFDEITKIWTQVRDESSRVRPKGMVPPDDFVLQSASIFIGVATYQDYRCGSTLYHAFTKAVPRNEARAASQSCRRKA